MTRNRRDEIWLWALLFAFLALSILAGCSAQHGSRTDFRTAFHRSGLPADSWCEQVRAFDKAWGEEECPR